MITPTRHDLPAPLVAADSPLSSDVMSRSVESLAYLWQVTPGCKDSAGTVTATAQGHTHDGRNDQTLFASSQPITGLACGFGSPYFRADSDAAYVSHTDPNGGWVTGAAVVPVIRSVVHLPFDATLLSPNCASFAVIALIEKGQTLSAANAVTVTATVGTVTLTGNSAAAATGLELVTVGPFAAGAMNGGPQELVLSLSSLLSADSVRCWHCAVVTL